MKTGQIINTISFIQSAENLKNTLRSAHTSNSRRESTGNAWALRERTDFQTLIQNLPDNTKSEILILWDEYEQGSTAEGWIVKGLDKLETIIQHNQGKNATNFDYEFNLTYGAK